MLLENKVVLITGAASGIGRASAQLFAREGASVIVSDKNVEGGNETVEGIVSESLEAVFVETDVGCMADVEGLVQACVKRYGRIDVVFSNACHYPMGTATELTEADWDVTMNVCLKATWMLAKHALPIMVEQGGGVFVITGSVHSLRGFSNYASYDPAKAGLLGLTRNLALDYAPHVRVNALLPGPIVTGLWKDMTPEEIQQSADSVPLKRNGTPEDVAKVALFLASDLSSYVTGTEVVVDGGMISGIKFP